MVFGILSFGYDCIANKDAGSKENLPHGKWAPVYNGGTTIQQCRCIHSLVIDDCAVGILSQQVSLCGGGEDPT